MKVKGQEQGVAHLGGLIAGVMTLAFVMSLGFGIWAFTGMQESQGDVDGKIAVAVAVAIQEAESAKDVEFAEKQKSPFKTYIGSATYGSLQFDYPKNWSIYAEEKASSIILDFYGHPNFIPGIDSDKTFAFRAQIVDRPYETQVGSYNSLVNSGKVTVKAFRPSKVPSQLGVIVQGEIIKGKTGVLVLLPQRDKTFKIWTESNDYISDFDKIMTSIIFVP